MQMDGYAVKSRHHVTYRGPACVALLFLTVFAGSGCTTYQERQVGMIAAAVYWAGVSSMGGDEVGFDVGLQRSIHSDDTSSTEGLLSLIIASSDTSLQTTCAFSRLGDGTDTTELAMGATGRGVLPRTPNDRLVFSQHVLWYADANDTSRLGWAIGCGVAHSTDSVHFQLTPQLRFWITRNSDDELGNLVSLALVARLGLTF